MYISAEDITTTNTNINTTLSSYTQLYLYFIYIHNSMNSLESKCYKPKIITNIGDFLLVISIFSSLV